MLDVIDNRSNHINLCIPHQGHFYIRNYSINPDLVPQIGANFKYIVQFALYGYPEGRKKVMVQGTVEGGLTSNRIRKKIKT